MRPLSAAELLALWEWGQGQTPLRRGLGLLAAASPDEGLAVLAQLPIGERDARLLTLREWSFGPDVTAVVDCPRCREQVELSFRTDEIRMAPAAIASAAAEDLTCEAAGYRVRFRLPNSLDVEAALAAGKDGRAVLLERCVLTVQRLAGGQPGAGSSLEPLAIGGTASELPPDVQAAVSATLEEADPRAKLTLAVTCPACAYPWQALFDIVLFFWSEINVWAQRMLREVHVLASAYHWSEAEILALSPRRRLTYLQLMGVV